MRSAARHALDIRLSDDFATCLALRMEIFVREQGVPAEIENDSEDAGALHLLARLDGEPVGTARLLREGTTRKIGRVCIVKRARGAGLGLALMRAAIGELEAIGGLTRVILGAQASALPFYRKLGFTPYGAPFESAGISHLMMERPLGH